MGGQQRQQAELLTSQQKTQHWYTDATSTHARTHARLHSCLTFFCELEHVLFCKPRLAEERKKIGSRTRGRTRDRHHLFARSIAQVVSHTVRDHSPSSDPGLLFPAAPRFLPYLEIDSLGRSEMRSHPSDLEHTWNNCTHV